ncbi:hypothetical protein QOT17_015673 [Balamuthia mandrillaris]
MTYLSHTNDRGLLVVASAYCSFVKTQKHRNIYSLAWPPCAWRMSPINLPSPPASFGNLHERRAIPPGAPILHRPHQGFEEIVMHCRGCAHVHIGNHHRDLLPYAGQIMEMREEEEEDDWEIYNLGRSPFETSCSNAMALSLWVTIPTFDFALATGERRWSRTSAVPSNSCSHRGPLSSSDSHFSFSLLKGNGASGLPLSCVVVYRQESPPR